MTTTITEVPTRLRVLATPRRAEEAALDLEDELRREVRGEVRFDAGSRALYATDLSIYRQVPIGVVIPHDTDDVEATITACRRRALHLAEVLDMAQREGLEGPARGYPERGYAKRASARRAARALAWALGVALWMRRKRR